MLKKKPGEGNSSGIGLFQALGGLKGKKFAKKLVNLGTQDFKLEHLIVDWIIHSLFLFWLFCTFGTLKQDSIDVKNSTDANKEVVYWLNQLNIDTEFLVSNNLGWYFTSIFFYSIYCVYSLITSI